MANESEREQIGVDFDDFFGRKNMNERELEENQCCRKRYMQCA
jgi:hypothetical protein